MGLRSNLIWPNEKKIVFLLFYFGVLYYKMNTDFMQERRNFTFGEVKHFDIVWSTWTEFRLQSSKPDTKVDITIVENQTKPNPLTSKARTNPHIIPTGRRNVGRDAFIPRPSKNQTVGKDQIRVGLFCSLQA